MPKTHPQSLLVSALSTLFLTACSASSSGGGTAPKDCNYATTYDAIQATVFEAKGCTASTCHGDAMLGALDLRADASFDDLVRQPSTIDSSIDRVFPGDQDLSLLFDKLAAATEGTDLGNLGQPMPIGEEPLSADQLEAMRLWIRAGAPSDSIVGGTLELLGCEGTFDPDPNKINPLPPPAADEGVQFYAGGWALDAESEDEVCFASYYDFTAQVPQEYQADCPEEYGEGRKCFAFRRNELAQDSQSHHSIITVYTPKSDPNGGAWGPWECLGGDKAGESCDPTAANDCGPRSQCTTPAISAVACVGYPYAPPDFTLGPGGGSTGSQVALSGAQESTSIDDPPVGVYSLLPLEGFVSWNSHGFNLTKKATSIEQWVNLTFAPESERNWLRQQIFEAGEIFAMSPVAPFTKREICMTWTLPQYSQLLSLSSHMHEHGELFRIWLPPNEPCQGTDNCLPPQSEADYQSRLYDDPVYTYYDPPNSYASTDAAGRTFKACAVYDNGADDPLEVKRESTKPNTPACDFFFGFCGCDAIERVCFGGDDQGASCNGDDSLCGEDGSCDACPLLGGVTTDDEMFIPLGSYFVMEP